MTDSDVIVVGAGPTGLMLACELAMRGIAVRLLERRAETPNITRAFAVHARTLELLDSRGMAEELLPRGVPIYEVAPAPGAVLDLTKLESRYPMLLIAPQSATERVLEARANQLGVRFSWGVEVAGLTQDADGVTVDARRRRGAAHEVRGGLRRCAQRRSPTRRRRLRRQPVRDAHPARRREDAEPARGGALRQDQRRGHRAGGAVRRRMVPCHRVGQAARAGAARRTRHRGGDPQRVRQDRRRGFRHDRDALEFKVSQ